MLQKSWPMGGGGRSDSHSDNAVKGNKEDGNDSRQKRGVDQLK